MNTELCPQQLRCGPQNVAINMIFWPTHTFQFFLLWPQGACMSFIPYTPRGHLCLVVCLPRLLLLQTFSYRNTVETWQTWPRWGTIFVQSSDFDIQIEGKPPAALNRKLESACITIKKEVGRGICQVAEYGIQGYPKISVKVLASLFCLCFWIVLPPVYKCCSSTDSADWYCP